LLMMTERNSCKTCFSQCSKARKQKTSTTNVNGMDSHEYTKHAYLWTSSLALEQTVKSTHDNNRHWVSTSLNVFNTCMMASLDYMEIVSEIIIPLLKYRWTNLGDRITPLFTESSTIGMNRILGDKMFHHIVGTKNHA